MNASRKISVLLASGLLCAATVASAAAREPRMHGPGGDGGDCATTETGNVPDIATQAKPDPVAAAKPAAAPRQVKPVVNVRGGGSDDPASVHAPRWHSFLPGMFR